MFETIYKIVESGKDEKAIKQALRSEFGTLEIPVAAFRFAELERKAFADSADGFWQKVFDSLVRELVNVDAWRQLAEMDPEAYRRGMDGHLAAMRRVMNGWCGIKPHRPQKDRERDDLIVGIRLSHPKWSFGQVAKEYKRKTGKGMTPNFAERIYKRCCERDVDDLIRMLRPELHLGPFLRSINFVMVE